MKKRRGEKSGQSCNLEFGYINKDGQYVTFVWTLSDEEFINSDALTLEQITEICNAHNPGLVERGFDKEIHRMCQELGVNPKVILATLGQEQGWCKPKATDSSEKIERRYNKAFGVGPGGNPNSYNSDQCGGVATSIKTFLKHYNDGLAMIEENGEIDTIHINSDKSPYPETRAVFKDGTANWQANNPNYVTYMEKGLDVIPVNAAMYAKLRYTPWVDFPPQGSHPLESWLEIYNSFDEYKK